MKCRISRNAAKVLKEILENEEDKSKKLRVVVAHKHGDHAHYALDFDTPKEDDVVVQTDKDIDVLLDKNDKLLDGVIINYIFIPEGKFEITNPSKGNYGDH
jgi:iron-sulfur cluster insertion protein